MRNVLLDGDLRRRERENERQLVNFLGMAGFVIVVFALLIII